MKGQFLTRALGEVTVKGKTQPVKIYAVLPEDIRKYPRRAGARHQPRRLCGEGLAGGVGEGQDDRDPVRRRGLTKPIKAEGSIVWRHDGIAGTEFVSLEPEAASVVADYVSSRTS